jgi:hypothetical protein
MVPRIPGEPPDERLSPGELHDRFTDVVNLSVAEMQSFIKSDYNRAYLERNSDMSQPGNEPIEDVIRLAQTPRDEWSDEDDGFNEVQEAREMLNYNRRNLGAIRANGLGNNTLPGELNDMTMIEAASIRWGIDPDSDREWL